MGHHHHHDHTITDHHVLECDVANAYACVEGYDKEGYNWAAHESTRDGNKYVETWNTESQSQLQQLAQQYNVKAVLLV